MKSIKAVVFAATILTSTLGAFPKHASAAVNGYLYIDGIPEPPPPPPPTSAVKTADIVRIVVSLLLG
ncbi:MAG: hypothetical protein WBC92_02440 [Terracidiphilus sp.]